MSHLIPLVTLRQPTGAVIRRLTRRLRLGGFRVEQTFDLQAARQSHTDCPCPNHGTEDCDCQMVILLVYGDASDVSTPLDTSPATLFLHGNDGQTWLSIADEPRQRLNPKLLAGIRQALNAPVSIPQDA